MYGGATLNLLNSLEISGRANYFKDTHPKGGSDREFNFQNMWYLFGRIDVKDTLGVDGFDKLKIGYGARELAVSEEWNESSRRIKTVERSAISNKIWPFDSEYSNPTGIWIESSRDNVSTELGVFSSTQDDWLASWDDGHVVWGKAVFDVSENSKFDKTEVLLNGWYQDAEISEDRLGGLCVLRRGHWAFDSTVFSGIMVIRLRPKEKVHFGVSLSYPLIGLLMISLRRSDVISIRDLTTLRE